MNNISFFREIDDMGKEIQVVYQLDRSQIRWVGRSLPIFFIFFFASMVIASLLNRLRIPHELITLVLGICIAGVIANVREYYIYNKNFIEPRNVMMILHPIIIMKLVYNIDTYLFSKSIMQILLISTLGLLIYIFIFGFLLVMLIPSKFITLSFINIVSAGIILAPIEVPDAILELDRIKHLEVLMNGECIFGTALCYMTFYLCLGGFEGIVTEWYHVICYYIRYIFVSIIIGFLVGKLAAVAFKLLYNDALNAATLMVGSSFFVYFLAEDIIYTSGPLATFIEMYCIALERGSLCADVDNSIQNYLNIGYYTGTLFFVILLTSNIVTSIYRLVSVLQVAVSLGSYVAGNVARLLILLMLSPILSRIGYGFNFTSMLALFWAPKKGPMQLLHISAFQYYNLTKYMGNEFICFTIMYLLLMALINSTSLKAILKRFGLLEFSEARKNNINNCFSYINERRIRLISIMKMNRFFSDANWPLIQSTTVLTNVFKGDTEESEADNENIWGQRKMICPGCSKNILVEPSIKDLADISREVRLRVLKAQRVSYAKQYENGLLTKIELRGLLQAVEIAMDSQDMIIKLDELFRMFNDKVRSPCATIVAFNNLSFFQRLLEKIKMYLLQFKADDSYMLPKSKCKRWLYKLTLHQAFRITYFLIIIIQMISLVVGYTFYAYHMDNKHMMIFHNTFFFALYLIQFIVMIIAYSNSGFKIACKYYARLGRSHWNKFDLLVLILHSIDVIVSPIIEDYGDLKSNAYLQFFLFTRVLRVVKLMKLLEHFFPKFITYCDRAIDVRVTYAFTIGKALVVGYDDVLEVLPKMSDNEKIRESIRLKLDSDRLALTKELGMLGKDRPWIAITVKTKQAMAATLIHMISNVDELKYAGIVDNYEYEKLYLTITDTLKDIGSIKSFPTMPPKSIFFEVPWIYEDDTIIHFLYNKVTTKIWDAGDIICKQGETAEGVFILVAGKFCFRSNRCVDLMSLRICLFKIKYVPVDEYLALMNNYGLLPIKDFLKNTRFKEIQDEYLMMGNSLGELSVLTNRPYSSTIIADAPSQAFIIPAKVMNEAIDISCDPVNGLAARLWKYITFILARRVMQDTPMYVSYSESKLNVILNRSFVPDLSCYRMVVLSELVEDVILIQGLIVDNNTREIYTAPCYVPRSVQKMLLPSASTMMHVQFCTKLIIIPVKDADQYETMEKIQILSELVNITLSFSFLSLNIVIFLIKMVKSDKKHLLEIGKSDSRSRRHSWNMKRKGKSRVCISYDLSFIAFLTKHLISSLPRQHQEATFTKVLQALLTCRKDHRRCWEK
ncbi:PREDICTED: LOW QUALITY PROTEIN: sodium/hydrogen exchanger 10-like [Nicrophorus vespilloides]|uniref:LOW QUALITY PROTEIN: sodium/hydrogen exchanger 10-like n=1 Tax=Nicrophorus vespilloides TaxID=110193 RepID=A0ABM1MAF4_NICVS|nr:PREDICTED: LOW QUALITY PROTEIN: sodium/hydrogen exchanger 10-like [Nicrophorus vespilloides]